VIEVSIKGVRVFKALRSTMKDEVGSKETAIERTINT
jgi:hypothetical protein